MESSRARKAELSSRMMIPSSGWRIMDELEEELRAGEEELEQLKARVKIAKADLELFKKKLEELER